MKTLNIQEVANKINKAKTDATKAKWEIYAIDNFSQSDYMKIVGLNCDYARNNQEFRTEGTYTDSMFA